MVPASAPTHVTHWPTGTIFPGRRRTHDAVAFMVAPSPPLAITAWLLRRWFLLLELGPWWHGCGIRQQDSRLIVLVVFEAEGAFGSEVPRVLVVYFHLQMEGDGK